MENTDVFDQLMCINDEDALAVSADEYERDLEELIDHHREWLKIIRRERPSKAKNYRVAVYIRYYNQTKYENYLDYHKKQFADTIDLVPSWDLVGFYIDYGMTAPNMETAEEWSRLLEDCMEQKVDLIITQKIKNISKRMDEVIWCSRLLAAQDPPIGIYFISEDVFTLASYYLEDLHDPTFIPDGMDEVQLQLEASL